MSFTNAKEHLKKYSLDNKIMEFDSSSATVKEAAAAIGCNEEEIAKTLSFSVNDKTILIVTAGDQKIDNAKFKAEFHTKAKMLSFEEVEILVGHAVGGVCPFAVNSGVDVYLDVSLKRFTSVFPACGSSNSAIELTIPQLEQYSGYKGWVDVCKGWESPAL